MDNYVDEKLGNYRLTRLLGVGGFAEVYLGEHIYLKTQAAIKLLRASLDDDALARFLTEARTIAHLDHPNIVRTLEFGVQESTAYLVMSYAPNGTVLRRYPRGSIVPLPIVIQYVRQLADALQYAHAHELIHRDVKPENILLGRDEGILLSDFGLAVMASSSQSRRPTDKAGTVYYMAPEQIEGKPSRASDQYALGVVVYEWLCGSLPFIGLDDEIAIQHLQVPPPSLGEQAPFVPSAIEQVVMKALAKDPSERFLSVLHFAQTLEEAYQPYKLVLLLPSGSNVYSADARDTPLKHDTLGTAESEPFTSSLAPSVLESTDGAKMISSPQYMPARQAALETSAQKTPRRISRQLILAVFASLIAVSAVSAGAIWSFHDLRYSASSPHSSSSIMQSSRTSEGTPGTMNMSSPMSGSSIPPTASGNLHPTPTQYPGSTSSTTSAPTAMPTPQATPTANTTSSSAYNFTASTPTPTAMPTPTPTAMPTTTPRPASVPLPIPTSLSIPTPLPIPTSLSIPIPQPGNRQQDTQGQNGQGQNGQ